MSRFYSLHRETYSVTWLDPEWAARRTGFEFLFAASRDVQRDAPATARVNPPAPFLFAASRDVQRDRIAQQSIETAKRQGFYSLHRETYSVTWPSITKMGWYPLGFYSLHRETYSVTACV